MLVRDSYTYLTPNGVRLTVHTAEDANTFVPLPEPPPVGAGCRRVWAYCESNLTRGVLSVWLDIPAAPKPGR